MDYLILNRIGLIFLKKIKSDQIRFRTNQMNFSDRVRLDFITTIHGGGAIMLIF
jgi:hypothetical protein